MATGVLFLDGFGHYTQVLDKWSAYTSNPVVGAYGRGGGSGAELSGQDNLQLNLGSVYGHLVVGFAMQFTQLVGQNPHQSITHFFGGGQYAHQVDIRVTRNGEIVATRNNNSKEMGRSNSNAFALDDRWQYWEVRVLFSGSVGVIEVRVDGVQKLLLEDQATVYQFGVNGADWVRIGPWWEYGQAVATSRVDDVYIVDMTVGSAGFLGDIAVETLLPTGAGSAAAWTPSGAASNYDCTNDPAPDDDTTYVTSSTVGHEDLYALPSLTRASGTVHGVQVVTTARADSVGAHQIAELVRSGTTNYTGTTHNLSQTYAPNRTVWGADPDNGAWSVATVNALEAGAEVIT